MKKILVTGGAGFIGSHTVTELLNSGFEPVIMDNFSNSDIRALEGLEKICKRKLIVYKLDCTVEENLNKIFSEQRPIAVIHFAAYKAVGESVENPLKYYHNNLASMVQLLKVMGTYGVTQLVFSSSCTIYGQPDILPVTEDSPERFAESPYGYTKQVCERIIRDYCSANRNFNCALLRYFNPIGAHESGEIGELPYGVPNNLVPYITQTAAGIRNELTIFGRDYDTPDGTCVRDFIHVTDLAQAHVKALGWLENQTGICEAFNIGQGVGNSVLEVVKCFEKVSGLALNYKIGDRRSGDIEKIYADVSKANKVLKWKTELSLEQALTDAWRWQKKLDEGSKK
jgi:UDP-glucose 4-epimerase